MWGLSSLHTFRPICTIQPVNDIAEITKQWQTFYGTLGGATATLLGLLFVSLALHSERIHEEENSHFRRLASLTFSNYLMLIIIALPMLVPMRARLQFVIPIAVAGLIGLFWSIFLRNRDLDKESLNAQFISRSWRLSFISYIMIVGDSILGYYGPAIALYFLLTPILMLLVVSVRNSWGLLLMLRTKSE